MDSRIELSKRAVRQLKKIPKHVVASLATWKLTVETVGLREARKIPGYHDEPLRGELGGLRSVRLNKAYRAYYSTTIDQGEKARIEIVRVERVDKHEY